MIFTVGVLVAEAFTAPTSPLRVTAKAMVARSGNFIGISFGVCGATEMLVGVAR
jgi:hypothetical protein